MVGIFSRLTGSKAANRSQHSSEDKEGLNISISKRDSTVSVADIHGLEPIEEFLPVDHPLEPPDKDQPIKCPPPEPSILHDGQIWKERVEESVRRRSEFSIIRNSGVHSQLLQRRRHTVSSEHLIAPSYSCPEHSLVKLLEECSQHTKS